MVERYLMGIPDPNTDRPRIVRDLDSASKAEYDVIVIGGGVLGAMIALEASIRSMKVLLLEKADFCSGTSYNSLKTIHGGLRHLQTLDIARHRIFVRERRWFLQQFPTLVRPLAVLMPLYGRGLQRPIALRAALLIDRTLSANRNHQMPGQSLLPDPRVVTVREAADLFPLLDRRGLRGGALWHDAYMTDAQRVVMEIIGRACDCGTTALNYVRCSDPILTSNGVTGVSATDELSGQPLRFRGKLVINAAGPWSREVADRFDKDYPRLFHHSIAWNILFDRRALSTCALAVRPPQPNGQVYFLHPWKGRLLIGTGHAPRSSFVPGSSPTKDEIGSTINDVNMAVPGLNLSPAEISHVYTGFLPVRRNGGNALTQRSRIIDHSSVGGPSGLFSIVCDKFTAARFAADKLATKLLGPRPENAEKTLADVASRDRSYALHLNFDDSGDEMDDELLRRLIADESVQHLDDLLLRRTAIGDNPTRALSVAERISNLFDWKDDRRHEEIQRIREHYKWAAHPDGAQ